MKKLVPIGLLLLLLYHALGHVFVLISVRWQEQYELSERVSMFQSVDHMVEFHIPLHKHPNEAILTQKPQEGFSYRGSYYDIISLDVSGDTLHITGFPETKSGLWNQDLLGFLKDQFTEGTSDTREKASNLLKLLLKEYSPTHRTRIWFFLYDWNESVRIPVSVVHSLTRSLPVFSPPPEV